MRIHPGLAVALLLSVPFISHAAGAAKGSLPGAVQVQVTGVPHGGSFSKVDAQTHRRIISLFTGAAPSVSLGGCTKKLLERRKKRANLLG